MLSNLLTYLLITFQDTKLKFQINEAKMRQYAKEVSTAESDSKYESSSSASPMKPETNDDNTNNSSNNNNNNIMAAMPKVTTSFIVSLVRLLTHLLTH